MRPRKNEVDYILELLRRSREQGFAALIKLDLKSVSDKDFQKLLAMER